MLIQDLTRWSVINPLGWGTCPEAGWEMMALRALKAGLLIYLGRQITNDSGIGFKSDDPGGGGGGAGVLGQYTNYLPDYVRNTPAGLPEYDGADWKAVNKALRKECKKLIKEVLKTL